MTLDISPQTGITHKLAEIREALTSEFQPRTARDKRTSGHSNIHPYLSEELIKTHKMRNVIQSVLLILGMAIIVCIAAVLLWGIPGIIFAIGGIFLLYLLAPRLPPEAVMRLYKARPVEQIHVSQLTRIIEILTDRAELRVAPRLYVIPSATLNAFATGETENATIAVTEGLLRRLSLREISAVLAHEISHIRNNDLWIMSLADTMSRLTQILSFTGIFLIIINLPLWLIGQATFSWTAAILLYLSPTISSLLQLALSRAREYDADLEGAQLTGDPSGLVSALTKLEHYGGRFWEDFVPPGRRIPQPSVLRTHPSTEERIKRLQDLDVRLPPISIPETPMITMVGYGPASLRPRYHWSWPGIWY